MEFQEVGYWEEQYTIDDGLDDEQGAGYHGDGVAVGVGGIVGVSVGVGRCADFFLRGFGWDIAVCPFYLPGIVLLLARLLEFDACNFDNVTRLGEVRLRLFATR